MNYIRFVSLSSGSSGNCYYLGTDSYGILIDAGISARQIKKSLAANGIAFESIVALCITHDHADHIKGAGYVGEKCGIPVYTTQTILNGMNRCYCMTQKIYSVGRPILKDVPLANDAGLFKEISLPLKCRTTGPTMSAIVSKQADVVLSLPPIWAVFPTAWPVTCSRPIA